MRRRAVLAGAAAAAVLWAAAAAAQDRPLASQEFDCLIDAQSRVKISASVAGLVERVHADRGDRVSAGQVLVELESSVERAQYEIARQRAANDQSIASARARLELAQSTAERLTRLRQTNIGALTATQFEEAVTEARVAAFSLRDAELTLETARVEAERARAVLAQRRIVSPIDGVVVERNMSPGEYRHEQAHFMTIARVDPLHVEVFVPVAFYGQTRPGAQAEVRPEAPIGGSYTATVAVVDRVLDAASGTFGVRLALANPAFEIPAGLRCRVRFAPMDATAAR